MKVLEPLVYESHNPYSQVYKDLEAHFQGHFQACSREGEIVRLPPGRAAHGDQAPRFQRAHTMADIARIAPQGLDQFTMPQ